MSPIEHVNVLGQEALLSTTESKKSASLTDSGVALSSSDPEELVCPNITDVFLNPAKTVACLSPEICLSPVETEVLLSMTNQTFCPICL